MVRAISFLLFFVLRSVFHCEFSVSFATAVVKLVRSFRMDHFFEFLLRLEREFLNVRKGVDRCLPFSRHFCDHAVGTAVPFGLVC